RLQGAPQIAAIEVGERFAGQTIADQECLCQAFLVQRTVEMTLYASLRVPGGFSVAHNDELGYAAHRAAQGLTRSFPPARTHASFMAFSWPGDGPRHISWRGIDSRDACTPGWWRCWSDRAFPEPRADLRSIAERAKRRNGAACADARAESGLGAAPRSRDAAGPCVE